MSATREDATRELRKTLAHAPTNLQSAATRSSVEAMVSFPERASFGAPSMTPGSREAKAAGCTCPVIDNGRGRGWMIADGEPLFVITDGCPLHDVKTSRTVDSGRRE